MSALVRGWDRYWFTPASAFRLGAFRIIVVAFQLWILLNRQLLAYGKSLNEIPGALYDPLVVFRILTLPLGYEGPRSVLSGPWGYRPTDLHLEIVHAIVLVSGVLALVGLRTRPALALFAWGNLFLQAFFYSFGEFHHPEALFLITLCVLPFSPAGASLSIDEVRRRLRDVDAEQRVRSFDVVTERSAMAGWPIKMVAWLMSLAYFSSALTKWMRSGHDWLNGYTLQYYLVQDGIRWGSELGLWLGGQHVPVVVMSWATILWEATFWLVLVVPALAIVYVPIGASFHLGTHILMRATFWHFHALYASFVPWDRLVLWARERLAPDRHALVVYDGRCPICLRSVTLLRSLDLLDRLRFADLEVEGRAAIERTGVPDGEVPSIQALRHEMHTVGPGGGLYTGFGAFRRIARLLPPLWALVPLVHLPGASAIGETLYRRVARSRVRLGGCVEGVCGRE
jgi:predicted DCC family thiol-disulfide oxidoreductase YuxK/uncharacterized membrane protein YphA (DoxX/SURF4 family)